MLVLQHRDLKDGDLTTLCTGVHGNSKPFQAGSVRPHFSQILLSLTSDTFSFLALTHCGFRGRYRLKFPELESLVLHPIDYARVVKRIGNEMDLTLVDLEGLLPSATIMVVSVTASTTTGKPLSEENLERVIDACDRALALDDAKKKMLEFVEGRMGSIAPNLSAIVGSAVAAQLMGTAGMPFSLYPEKRKVYMHTCMYTCACVHAHTHARVCLCVHAQRSGQVQDEGAVAARC